MKMVFATIKVTVFLLIGTAMFCAVQNVLTPDWSYDANRILGGASTLEDDTIDVLFLGTSHVEHGISPMRLYEDTQIPSYSLATSAQPVEGSYYLLKKALQTQSPKVVVFDVAQLFEAEDSDQNASWRYLLDNLPMDSLKLDMSKTYEELWFSDGMLSALFPIVKYHTRWNGLSLEDFEPDNALPHYSAGQRIMGQVAGTSFSLKSIERAVNTMLDLNSTGYMTYVEDEEIVQETVNGDVYAPSISARNMEYFLKIHALCEAQGIELLLIKIPVVIYPTHYKNAWTGVKYDQTMAMAEKYDIPYLDFMYNTDIGIDMATDTYDGGAHLNMWGAEKITTYLGTYLLENYDLKESENSTYEYFLSQYQHMRELTALQAEKDFTAYMEKLMARKENCTIYIAASDNVTPGLKEADYVLLEGLGLQLIRDVQTQGAYLAVINGGDVVYEAVSNRRINYQTTIDEKPVELVSSGWLTVPTGTVTIDGTQYARNSRGLNIVVYDHEAQTVIDSITFDTWSESKPASKNWTAVNTYLRTYEDIICFGGEG